MDDWEYHCKVLGISRTATVKEIRKAYRRLALKHHPDKNQNKQEAKELFLKISESYRFLLREFPTDTKIPRPQRPPSKSPPDIVRTNLPTRPPKKSQKKTARFLVGHVALFAIMIWISLWEEQKKQAPSAREEHMRGTPSWCSISIPGDSSSRNTEIFEKWTESECRSQCNRVVSGKTIKCSWDGVTFRGSVNSASSGSEPQKPVIENEGGACEVALENQSGKSQKSSYKKTPENICKSICSANAESEKKEGIKCTWNGSTFFDRPPRPTTNEGMARGNASDSASQVDPNEESNSLRETCFISIAEPGNIDTKSLPGSNLRECRRRCIMEIIRHRINRAEVICSIDGTQFIRHLPVPVAPPQSNSDGQDPSLAGICEIEIVDLGKISFTTPEKISRHECLNRCLIAKNKYPEGTPTACKHRGELIFSEFWGAN